MTHPDIALLIDPLFAKRKEGYIIEKKPSFRQRRRENVHPPLGGVDRVSNRRHTS
ncbi:MAG: hypothetical protein JWQ34_3701 [Mucilaginibacter sp.]|nr:hypothetical protein [Mucilaginibacter sp.]